MKSPSSICSARRSLNWPYSGRLRRAPRRSLGFRSGTSTIRTCRTGRFLLKPVKNLVSLCRARTNAPIVLGGAGYSMFPDAALAYLGADLGICGEGEVIFPALLERLQQGQDPSGLPGVHVAGRGCQAGRQFAPDLDCLPLPDNILWLAVPPTTPDLWVPVQTRRGCALDCTYCSTADIEGRAVRARSPQLVIEHIRRVADAGFERFFFVDNTFNFPLSYAMELCRRITAQRLNIAWRCILYPHRVPEELVAAMAEAGCVEVSLGFESGSKDVLRAHEQAVRSGRSATDFRFACQARDPPSGVPAAGWSGGNKRIGAGKSRFRRLPQLGDAEGYGGDSHLSPDAVGENRLGGRSDLRRRRSALPSILSPTRAEGLDPRRGTLTSELNRSWQTASATVVNLFVHSTRSLPGIPYEVDSILSTDRCHSLQIRRLIWREISELRNRLLKTSRLADDQEFPWNIAYILEPEGMLPRAV